LIKSLLILASNSKKFATIGIGQKIRQRLIASRFAAPKFQAGNTSGSTPHPSAVG
jgi:hypothetical protein